MHATITGVPAIEALSEIITVPVMDPSPLIMTVSDSAKEPASPTGEAHVSVYVHPVCVPVQVPASAPA